MILDSQSKFSDAQAVTVTAISTNVLDLRNSSSPALADEGMSGPELWLVIQAGASFTAAGAGTLTITLESSATADLATSPTIHATIQAIAIAGLVAGSVLARMQIPSGDYKRYLGVRYTVATGPFTAGAVSAFVTPDIQRNITYPTSYTVA